MLPYDICVALKKSGFVQFGRGTHFPVESKEDKTEASVYSPTLEELIEACGERFHSLLRYVPEIYPEDKTLIWRAYNDESHVFFGHTPSEAVANLYLAITK